MGVGPWSPCERDCAEMCTTHGVDEEGEASIAGRTVPSYRNETPLSITREVGVEDVQ